MSHDHGAPPRGENFAPHEAGIVNVIFHGLFVFVERRDKIQILIPNLEQHVYSAGSFQGERRLSPRPLSLPYVLRNVTAGTARFDGSRNILFDGFDFESTLGPKDLFAMIEVPTPKEIFSLRPTLDPYVGAGPNKALVDGKRASGVQVLQYAAIDLSAVSLEPHDATLSNHEMSGADFINIHVFADPDGPVDPNHPIMGFDRAVALLSKLAGTVTVANATTLVSSGAIPAQNGFHKLETLDCLERERVLILAGMDWRDNRLFLPQTGLVANPPQSCAPILVRPSRV